MTSDHFTFSKADCKNIDLIIFCFFKNLGNTPPASDGEQNLVYRLSKCEIDDAHKDKAHKIYPPNFEVIKKKYR